MRKAWDQTRANWITDHCHHNGDSGRGVLDCLASGRAIRDDYIDFVPNQIRRQLL